MMALKLQEKDQRSPTLRDVANQTGFSLMTVSRAMRNASGVHPETRKQVMAAAAQLSYRPNPVMTALASYRTRIKGRNSYSQVAFVNNFSTRDGWKSSPWTVAFFEGAKERGAELGYDVVNFWLREDKMTQRRASVVLFNRGIKGLLLAPAEPGKAILHYNLDWENFATVGLGYPVAEPRMVGVMHDRHAAGLLACHHLRRLGFCRIGLALWRGSSIRIAHTLVDAFVGEQVRYPHRMGRIPPLIWEHFGTCGFASWFETHQPDVVLTHAEGPLEEAIRELPAPAWRNTPVVYAALNESHPVHWPGVRSNTREAGAIGIEQLNALLLNGQFGVSSTTMTCMIHGTWQAPPEFGKSRVA